ncbi:alpha/beta fold hydrolase [Streptomyces albofaciens]|uniref:alpha/beta fold hydrolase n=1 Tax=Streptomyces albofaciens TaxID=66866 RepID=UPI000B0125AF|nr:alpha/beta fold hydrolase [Streptomyces albofaciens]
MMTAARLRFIIGRPVALTVTVATLTSGAMLTAGTQATAATGDPVVFLHGLNDGPGVWKTADQYFHDNHYAGKIHRFDYSGTTHDRIPDNADRFWEWMKKNGLAGKRVNLVGHSMGGLVARKAALDHSAGFTVGSLVTLASPNHGSHQADLCPNVAAGLCNAAVQDMKTDSHFLKALNRDTEKKAAYAPDTTLTYSIEGDEQVSAHSVKLSGADNRHVAEAAETVRGGSAVHTSITRKRQVLKDTLDFLNTGNNPGAHHKLTSGPALRNADCTIHHWTHGTVRWDLPRHAPDDLKAEVWKDGRLWGTVPASDKGIVDRLPYGTMNIRFKEARYHGYTSAYSSVTFDAGTWQCDSTIKNASPTVHDWPGSDPIATGSTYRVSNKHFGNANIDAGADASLIHLWHSNGTAAQDWKLIDGSNGNHKLLSSKGTNRCLSQEADQYVGTRECGENSAQLLWKLVPADGGSFSIKNVGSGGHVNSEQYSFADGTRLRVWGNHQESMKWVFRLK